MPTRVGLKRALEARGFALAGGLLAALATLSRASTGHADGAGSHAPCAPCASCTVPASPGERLHDGFFARADAGIAFLTATLAPARASSGRTRVQGIGQSSSLAVGGTPMRGLVVGGNLWAARIDPWFIEHGVRVVPDDDSIKVTLLRVGPFVDWYPDPKRGFHVQLSLELALQIESDAKGKPIEPGATGPFVGFGAGHEWFVSKSFSLGFLGRLGFARLSSTTQGVSERALTEVAELAISSTYH